MLVSRRGPLRSATPVRAATSWRVYLVSQSQPIVVLPMVEKDDPDQREDLCRSSCQNRYTRHEVAAPREVGPSGRTRSCKHLRPGIAAINIRAKRNERNYFMESNTAARRTEDIALDLLKFVAAQANVGSKSAGSTGFGVSTSTKPEDQIAQLLELYARCRQAVEAPVATK